MQSIRKVLSWGKQEPHFVVPHLWEMHLMNAVQELIEYLELPERTETGQDDQESVPA